MGREAPLPIRPLPKPLNPIHLLGPGMAVTALGVGLGETFMWPRLVIVFGPNVRWLFLIGVTVQLFVMIELARYAMATGESIFFGAARVHRLAMWFFFVCALLIYVWPGHMAAGAQALVDLVQSVSGATISWTPIAIVGLLLVGLILTFSKYIYAVVESTLTVMVSILVIGSAIIASLVGTFQDLVDTISGTFAFGVIPEGFLGAAWAPIVVGSIAFAGPSGMQQMWYTLWLRDKGAGMGSYIPKIQGLRGIAGEETMPARGYTFDTEDPQEMEKWRGWRRWNLFDAIVLFWGITMVTTIIFTVLAITAGRVNPDVRGLIESGDESAAIAGMASAFGQVGGSWTEIAFFLFIGIIGWKASFGLFDALSRGQADMTYYFIPRTRRWSMSRQYLAYVWFVVLFGIIIVLANQGNEPTFILSVLAFLSPVVMGAYCLLMLFTNNRVLPRKLRPGWASNIALSIGVLLYFGGLAYSLIWHGAFPD